MSGALSVGRPQYLSLNELVQCADTEKPKLCSKAVYAILVIVSGKTCNQTAISNNVFLTLCQEVVSQYVLEGLLDVVVTLALTALNTHTTNLQLKSRNAMLVKS